MGSIYVRYLLLGDFDPNEVTARVGVTPTLSLREGEWTSPRKVARSNQGIWEVESAREPEDGSLLPLVEWILFQLQPGWTVLAELGRTYEAYLECVLHIEEFSPDVEFPPRVLEQITELNATLLFGIY